MAPLKAFGRRWHIASDMFVFGGIVTAVGTVGLGCVYLLAAMAADEALPEQSWWMYLGVGKCAIAAIIDASVAWISSRGPVWDEAPRAPIARWLTVRLAFSVVEVIYLCWFTIFFITYVWESELPDLLEFALPAVMLIEGGFLFWSLVWLWCVTPAPGNDEGEADSFLLRGASRKGLGMLTRVAGQQTRTDLLLETLKKLMSAPNVTVSDVLFMLVLLRVRQQATREARQPERLADLHFESESSLWGPLEDRILQGSCGGALPDTKPVQDVELVKEILRNLGFASAMYGWGAIVMMGGGEDVVTLDGQFRNKCCRNFRRCCKGLGEEQDQQTLNRQVHSATAKLIVKKWPGLEKAEMIFLSDTTDDHKSPYAVFVDHDKRNVVLAIRGSWSLQDVVTDLSCESAELPKSEITGPGPGPHYVHLGMWEAAQSMFKDIEDTGVLKGLLADEEPAAETFVDKRWSVRALPKCGGYGLMVVGHSLGAALAQLLSSLYRPAYPDVRCIAYAGPPVCSEAMAKHNSKNTTNVVAGDDMVPRLNARALEFLRDRSLSLVAHCSRSKFRVLLRAALGCLQAEWLFEQDVVNQTARDWMAQEKATASTSPAFFHTKQIVYLRMEEKKSFWQWLCPLLFITKATCSAEFAKNEDFGEVLVDINSGVHHHPEVYRSALQAALKDMGAGPETTPRQAAAAEHGAPGGLRAEGRDVELAAGVGQQ